MHVMVRAYPRKRNDFDRLSSLLEQVILGTLTSGEASAEVLEHWERGRFIHHLPADCIPPYECDGRALERYGCSSVIQSYVLYGKARHPGCVVVTAPADDHSEQDLSKLHVAPHTHPSDHIAVVVEGNGIFYVERDTPSGRALIYEQAVPGTMMLYPAGTPHTFRVGSKGIVVASMQCEFEPPTTPTFAEPADEAVNALPRIPYRDYLSTLSV